MSTCKESHYIYISEPFINPDESVNKSRGYFCLNMKKLTASVCQTAYYSP